MLAEQIKRIVKTELLVPIQDGSVELCEPNVMSVVVAEVPTGAAGRGYATDWAVARDP